jgi:PAS domain S-box-containing protein
MHQCRTFDRGVLQPICKVQENSTFTENKYLIRMKQVLGSNEVVDFKNLFESAPGLFLVLTTDLKIAAVSNAYLKATMTTRDVIVGKQLFEVFPDNPQDPQASGVNNLNSSLQRVINKKAPDAMPIQKYDIQRPASEGGGFEERFWKPVNTPVINSYGDVGYIIHQVEDVTEVIKLQRSKEAFAETEIKYRQLIETAPDGVISINDKGLILNWNLQAEKMFGWSETEVVGKKLSDIIIPEQSRELHNKGLIEFLRTGKGPVLDKPIEVSALKKNGDKIEIELKISASKINDQYIFIGFLRDMTESKRLNNELESNIRQLQAVNDELEALCYSIAHDLRTPLRAIHGYTKIISSDFASDFNDEAKKLMGDVMYNAKKMGQLIDDLLTFSRIGRKKLAVTEIDMKALVDSVVADIQHLKPSRSTITVNSIPFANGDYNLIIQVFINLITNAIKFSTQREKAIIEIGAIQNDNGNVYFVKDNGTGFDMQYYDKLFGIFQRLHHAKEHDGTGIGLALTKRIIIKHGGRIWADSKLDQGSTFYFSLNEQKSNL